MTTKRFISQRDANHSGNRKNTTAASQIRMAEHKTKPDLNLFFIEWCRSTTRLRLVPSTSVWKIPAQQRQRGAIRYTKHNHTHTHTLHDIHSLSLFCLVLVPFHRPASIATTPTTTLPNNQRNNQPTKQHETRIERNGGSFRQGNGSDTRQHCGSCRGGKVSPPGTLPLLSTPLRRRRARVWTRAQTDRSLCHAGQRWSVSSTAPPSPPPPTTCLYANP